MRKLLFLLPIFALLGCSPEAVYRVYYHSPEATAGKVPVDQKAYMSGETVTILGQGTLKNKDYNFLGWTQSGYYYNEFINQGDKVTINWEDLNLFAVWDDGTGTPFLFEIKDNEVTITGLNTDYSRIVVIPDTLQGKSVTAIDDTALSNLAITEVRLPKNLKRIGVGAFAGNKITGIIIPDTVEFIGMGAFRDNSLTRVTFGTGLKALESHTFYNNELINIVIPPNITTVKTGAFGENDIVFIRLGANVDIQADKAFGTNGDEFRTFYNTTKGKAAGLYQYNNTAGTWE
jgi:hypothetical protein